MGLFFSAVVAGLVAVANCSPYGGHGIDCTTSLDLVYQYSQNGTWVENLVVRPNGHILVTRIDLPQLDSIDPDEHTATPVHSFTGPVTSLLGITKVRRDFYAIIGANRTAAFSGEKRPGYIFTADFTKTPPVFKRVAVIRESFFLNGIAAFSKDIVLVSDSGNGVLYRVDLTTGSHSIAASGPPLSAPGPFPADLGANGLKILGRFAYFTSSSRGVYGRVPLSSDGHASGAAQTIATTGTFLDDFVISNKQVAYAATNANDSVLRITPDGSVQTVAGQNNTLTLAGSTCLTWVPGSKQREAYVGTAGGQFVPVNGVTIEPAKVVKLTLGPGCYH